MPVPVLWTDISTNPALNSPSGSEPIGTLADDYIRQAYAYSKQLHDGWLDCAGVNKFTASLNANGFTVTGLGAPVNPGDACTKSYADALISGNFPHGFIALWFGTAATKPAGWLICDGTQGTPDMRNRFPIGAGDQTAYGQAGGNSFPVISSAQMPSHAHGISDPGHAHGVNDGGHSHGVYDPGHAHTLNGNWQNTATGNSSGVLTHTGGADPTGVSGTGISINGAATGIGIAASGTGLAIQAAGGNAAFDNRPAFMGLYYIMKA